MIRSSIDWQEVRGRLQKNEEVFADTVSENPRRMTAVFRQRAIELAHARTAVASPGFPALIFRLGREKYAIALKELAEVLPFKGCTQVPGASPQFLGVINLRGELRPVLDLARVLSGVSGGDTSDSGAVLILRGTVGLKVDSVEALREIRSDELRPPVEGQYCQAFVSGTVALLDVETMLSTVFSAVESRIL